MSRYLALAALFLFAHSIHAADELTVLPDQLADGPPKQMLKRYLAAQTKAAFAARQAEHGKLKTTEDVAAYQAKQRTKLLAELGLDWQRTPLHPQVVGELKGDGYRAEKIIFESQPKHFVTAVIFLPLTKGPHPAVLVPAGHSRDGKASNSRVCILLAQNGIAGMCYDPIGQGERVQLFDEKGKQRFPMTQEHTLLGSTAILTGRGTATFRIWDGMRAIDYLCSRPDIDPKKIGATGCSGGGTLTSYLMALDERVACAAPSCYITSFPRLLATLGPQDAEQNIHGQLAAGIDHADYLHFRAPQPTLILASTHDFFDISGTWDTYREAKRLYTRLGYPERVNLIETDAKHGYPKLQREAMASWMSRWLLGKDQRITEGEFDTPTEAQVQCTPKGQVMLMDGARSVTDLLVELDSVLASRRKTFWEPTRHKSSLDMVRSAIDIGPGDNFPKPVVRAAGTLERDGYSIEKLVLEPEPGIAIPGLLYRPSKVTGEKILYVHGLGKQAVTAQDGPLENLVRAGNIVYAIDVRGCGETGSTAESQWGGDWNDIFTSYLLGESILGRRTEDILIAARHLNELEPRREKPGVRIVAVGVAGPPALHAAALHQVWITGLELEQSLSSWSNYLAHPETKGQLVNSVHKALYSYDLPDLIATLPYKVVVREPVLPDAK